MPLPDNYSSSAFNRVWGRDKIMPRELNRDERATLASIASAIDALRQCIRTIDLLPRPPHLLAWGLSNVSNALRAEITSLKSSDDNIRRIPQDEADEANDLADMDA